MPARPGHPGRAVYVSVAGGNERVSDHSGFPPPVALTLRGCRCLFDTIVGFGLSGWLSRGRTYTLRGWRMPVGSSRAVLSSKHSRANVVLQIVVSGII